MTSVSKLAVASVFIALGMTGANAQQAAQPGTTPSTVDAPAQQKGDQKQTPKTTGAMDNAVTGIATSPDDVRRQTEGKPTAADEAKGVKSTAPKPEVTQQSPGTVGAAPGTTPAPDKK